MKWTMSRRIGAVLAGLAVAVVLSIGTDLALVGAGVFPPLSEPRAFTNTLLLFATLYRSAYAALGSYVAARLARDSPMAHALVLGAIGLTLSTIGAVTMWNVGPNWYPLALIATAMPCAWRGGRLRAGAKT